MAKPDEILLKLEIQESKVRDKIDKLKESVSKLDGRKREYKRTVKELQLEEQKLYKVRGKRIARQKELAKSTKNLAKVTQESSKATGGATASVLELGRVISDAPYGIRGMANNLSQLATSMAFTFKASGGLVAGLKSLWSALLGPLGVILAINTLLSVLESNAIAQNKNTDAVNEGTEALKKQITPLEKLINLYKSLKGVLFSDNDSEALRSYKQGVLSLDETVKIITRNFSEFKNAYDKLSEAQKKDGTTIKALLDGYYELLKLRKQEEEQVSRMQVLREDISKNGEKIMRNGLAFTRAEVVELQNLEREYVKTQKRLIQLEDYFSKESDKNKKKKERVTVSTELEMVDPNKIAKFNQKILKEIADKLGVELGKTPIRIAPKIKAELSPETQAAIDEYNKRFIDTMSVKMAAEDWAGYADAFKQGLSLVSDFVDAQFERDLATEQNKTNAMNDELNQRLLNENLSKDERAKIQQEIWQNDDKLRKKQNEIKKKQFNANKAFQISMAVADTASSALKAYGSQLVVGDPTSIVRAKIAAGVATAIGLAQVATIASQKFVPESASTPIRTASAGGGGGGVGDRSFNFNLVGASQQNQLAQAIQGTFDKPIKAYVVSKDITNQQQLDANTKSTARFGG